MGVDVSSMQCCTYYSFDVGDDTGNPAIDAVRKALGLASTDDLVCSVSLNLNRAEYAYPDARQVCHRACKAPDGDYYPTEDIFDDYSALDDAFKVPFEEELLAMAKEKMPINAEEIAKELKERRREQEAYFNTPVKQISTGTLCMNCNYPEFTGNERVVSRLKDLGYTKFGINVDLIPDQHLAKIYSINDDVAKVHVLWEEIPETVRNETEAAIINHAWIMLPKLLELPPLENLEGCSLIPDTDVEGYDYPKDFEG